jgi:hypothetical protein
MTGRLTGFSSRLERAKDAARAVIATAERQEPGNDWLSVRIARRHIEALLAEVERRG